ncbi:hypothetical protein LOAG_04561 [Loa loa]|uniref:Uncharacterized protein n=1 Tax=Loa loa TaxID=7209 RepID=A0A1S0U242_LOALO|nr:hypothetical protein LOAG_04561 [Loa loa]EFO23924.1 hypothetical protein LOAG_04561 [Loa loa]
MISDERKLDRSMVPPYTSAVAEIPKTKDMVDLELIIRNWAKQIFEVTKTREEAKINKKHLEKNQLKFTSSIVIQLDSQQKNEPITGKNFLANSLSLMDDCLSIIGQTSGANGFF